MRPLKFSEEFDALAIVEAAKLRDAYAPSRPPTRLLKDTEESLAEEIAEANEFTPAKWSNGTQTKPRLLVKKSDPDVTVAALRDILAKQENIFERGVPVRLVWNQARNHTVIQTISADALILLSHQVCRPYEIRAKKDGSLAEQDCQLPKNMATMYLSWEGYWNLRPLNGITPGLILFENGEIFSGEGYNESTGIWQENVPDLSQHVPASPSKGDAEAALRTLRETFATFCFADASTHSDPITKVVKVDLAMPPGRDESAFLNALLTAVCRPSLHLAPGILIHAAPISGAGSGKGLLARCIANIAFGREPHAVTAGPNNEELEKRIAAELIQGSPVVFLDNLNNRAFKSDQLASAITERPSRVRNFGTLTMAAINTCALVILTGNGLTVTEDLARRFLAIELDARSEDPESRKFIGDIHSEVITRRVLLLAACLTIWRWGRQRQNLESGIPLGSFEQWCRWVRDPLIALGCQDPTSKIREAKSKDSHREQVAAFFTHWWATYEDKPVTISTLEEGLARLIDPQNRGRQYLAAQIQRLVGTRVGGLLLSRQPAAGKWGTATYAVTKTSVTSEIVMPKPSTRSTALANGPLALDQSEGAIALTIPMPPMPPMPNPADENLMQDPVPPRWSGRI